MIYTYDSSYWKNYDKANTIEWVLTNGLGSYSGASLIGGKNRTHQGYLVASLHNPTCRYVCFEQLSEWIAIGSNQYDLETSKHRINGQSVYSRGSDYLDKVSYDGTVKYEYTIKDPSYVDGIAFGLDKHIGLVRENNTVVIDYLFTNNTEENATVVITPQFNYREHNTLTTKNDLQFHTLITGDTLSLVPYANNKLRIDFSISEGTYYELKDKYDIDYELQTEVDLETEGLCTHYMPYEVSIDIPAQSSHRMSIVCSVVVGDEETSDFSILDKATDAFVGSNSAQKLIAQIQEYYATIENRAGYEDEFVKKLILDADHFLVNRKSTGMKTVLAGLPWFTDWGRDTMIAFTGLTLCTKRYSEAQEILKTFAMYVHNGMVPNMFPDDGEDPLYNTVDASLWYFYATYKYLEYIRKEYAESNIDSIMLEEAETFVGNEIYPVLKQILNSYENGTAFSIYMIKEGPLSGLLHAGSDLDQITWMDVRIGDKVVTPRHGCPVEINALWFNALRIGALLAGEYEKDKPEIANHWTCLAEKVYNKYESTFWNEEIGCLADVVNENGQDTSIRPNQIYAISLPFVLLSKHKERAVVETVYRELYVGCGLRSLSREHKDYHGQYRGALEKRDLSYHQGTAWGFLLGGFITAYAKVLREDGISGTDLKTKIEALLEPIKKHQSEENCIGGICEIFEGDEPHTGCGCYTQAWSTGEILRAYVEEYLRK